MTSQRRAARSDTAMGLERIVTMVLPGGVMLGILLSSISCERSVPPEEAESPGSKAEREIGPADPRPRVEAVFSSSDPATPSETKEEAAPAGPILYEPGDSFQGMWHHDRRNANLRLTIESVDPEIRRVTAVMQSRDLDNSEKQFEGAVGADGRELVLTGVVGTGSGYRAVDGYDVRDFLRRGSNLSVRLDDCNGRELRGEVENGTSVYFWSNGEPK